MRLSSGLTPAAAGVLFSHGNSHIPPLNTLPRHIPPPLNIPQQYPTASPGTYHNNIPNVQDRPPHLPQFVSDEYVPPHRNTHSQMRPQGNGFFGSSFLGTFTYRFYQIFWFMCRTRKFSLDIREQLKIFNDCFTSDKACINCVAHHFGIKDKKVGITPYT